MDVPYVGIETGRKIITDLDTNVAAIEEDEKKKNQTEKLVDLLPEPPRTNPETESNQLSVRKELSDQVEISTEKEAREKVEIPVEKDPPDVVEIPEENEPPDDVEIILDQKPPDGEEMQSGNVISDGKSEESNLQTNQGEQEKSKTESVTGTSSVFISEEVKDNPDINRSDSECYYSTVSSIEDGVGDENVPAGSQQELKVMDMQPEEIASSNTEAEESNCDESISEESIMTNKDKTTNDVMKPSEMKRETETDVTLLDQNSLVTPASDTLYPVLNKFMEQVSVSSEKLEVISCSVGPSSGTASAPRLEGSTDRAREGQSRGGMESRPRPKPRLQPFTREQLHSLYYNAQLVNNPAFIDRFVQVSFVNDPSLCYQ